MLDKFSPFRGLKKRKNYSNMLFIYYNALIISHLANGHKIRVIFGLDFSFLGHLLRASEESGFRVIC